MVARARKLGLSARPPRAGPGPAPPPRNMLGEYGVGDGRMGITDGAKRAAGAVGAAGKGLALGYRNGLTYPFKGMRLVFVEHPSLVRFWIVPILLTVAMLGAVGWGGWVLHEPVADAVYTGQSPFAGEPEHAVKVARPYDKAKGKPVKPLKPDVDAGGWIGALGRGALGWVALALLWGVGLLLVMTLSTLVAAPFNDLLSEEVEHLVLGTEGGKFSWKLLLRDTLRTIGLEALKWTLYAVVMGALFVLGLFIPVIGSAVSSVIGFSFTTLYLAVDFIDWPASRRDRDIRYRFEMLKEHFWAMFGFGTGVWLLLFVPLVNLLFLPAAVAGGTLLYLDLEGHRAAPG
jgi:CysZ protein